MTTEQLEKLINFLNEMGFELVAYKNLLSEISFQIRECKNKECKK